MSKNSTKSHTFHTKNRCFSIVNTENVRFSPMSQEMRVFNNEYEKCVNLPRNLPFSWKIVMRCPGIPRNHTQMSIFHHNSRFCDHDVRFYSFFFSKPLIMALNTLCSNTHIKTRFSIVNTENHRFHRKCAFSSVNTKNVRFSSKSSIFVKIRDEVSKNSTKSHTFHTKNRCF